MKLVRDIGLLFQRQARQLLRNPVWLVVGFSTPILYLALFTPLLNHAAGLPGRPVLDLFLPGILSLLAFSSGASSGFSTIFELKSGVIERLRVTPASRFAILTGPILASMAMMLVFDAVVVPAWRPGGRLAGTSGPRPSVPAGTACEGTRRGAQCTKTRTSRW